MSMFKRLFNIGRDEFDDMLQKGPEKIRYAPTDADEELVQLVEQAMQKWQENARENFTAYDNYPNPYEIKGAIRSGAFSKRQAEGLRHNLEVIERACMRDFIKVKMMEIIMGTDNAMSKVHIRAQANQAIGQAMQNTTTTSYTPAATTGFITGVNNIV
jgi:hypothetical protein